MTEKVGELEKLTTDGGTVTVSPYSEERKASIVEEALPDEKKKRLSTDKQKKGVGKSVANFIYDPRRKTVLGRSALNWSKLAAFYSVFYFCLGMFFVGLLLIYTLLIDREIPTYYNKESTMAVRTTATVVGMGYRPQPYVDDNLIRVTNDRDQQTRIASSLQLYRDVYLTQRSDAKVEECSENEAATGLPHGTACAFSWNQIVNTESHPCSEKNLYGFKSEEPCVLVKLNKVYGWTPKAGHMPSHIQRLRNIYSNRTVARSDVYVTCEGTNPADKDVLQQMIYYSLEDPSGSSKYGSIPSYYFPYRNARDHVQPFVLVQFKNLPLDRTISVTCRAWAPNIEHDTRAMRGMVNFQLYRTHQHIKSKKEDRYN